MENAPLLVPLLIFVPAMGTFINFFWGAKMGERAAGYLASAAAIFTFFISVLIFYYLDASHGHPIVVDPLTLFDGWIRIGANEFPVEITWQFRVDTLTGNMLLVVSGVGSLIHLYSVGYIHGDPKAPRFFAFLNMFLAFMLLLVTGNNLLMMFVGWEGVGVCSFLLIGYWWDKKGETGWQNANAARKAMILNRVGDFGILMAIFLTFWTFGTLDYFRAGEINNPCYALDANGYTTEAESFAETSHSVCVSHHAAEEHAEDAEHSEDAATTDDSHGEESAASTEDEHATSDESHGEADDHSVAAAGGENSEDDSHGGSDDGHGEVHYAASELDNSQFEFRQLGIFAQAEYLLSLEEGNPQREVRIGTWTLDVYVVVGMIALFLLLGAAGKSAQIPLFVWLPDAMAGPTPVSALMHAATMVTAGVYLLVRSSTFLELVPEARYVVALVGASTAFAAGLMAVGQWDIKRVLAFSTVSQLGFMVAAIGVGGYVAAMFHLTTHAIFKALLFLGSGSVIHGVEHGHHHVHAHGHHDDEHGDKHHEEDFDPQDMRNMGGLASRMPYTFITYLIGTFGLMGLPFFAGFWSKDEIIVHAFDGWLNGSNPTAQLIGLIVFGLLVIAAFFTTFYMWRQIQMVFFGKPRSEAAEHAGGNGAWMILPLIVLAYGTFTIGFINIPEGTILFEWMEYHWYGHFLEASIPAVSAHPALNFDWLIALGTSVALPAVAIFLAHMLYAGDKSIVERDEHAHELGKDPLAKNPAIRPIWTAANRRLYWDDIYHAVFLYPYERIGKFLANTVDWNFWHDYFHNNVVQKGFNAIGNILSKPIDAGIIDAVVNGLASLVNFVSGRSRGIQTGYVRTYAVALFFGVVVVIVLMLLPLLLSGS